ncbi:MAG: glycosyltransferase [Anaerolineales bacterium]
MKILHLYKDYYPVLGGIEGHIQSLAEAQAAAGHQVTVLVTNPDGQRAEEELNGVRVVRLPRLATAMSTPLTLAFIPYLRKENPQITHLHFPYPVAELSQLVAGRGHPYVITYHSDVIRPAQQIFLRFYRPILWRVLRGARRILVGSPSYLKTSPFLAAVANRCVIVPFGIDPRPFVEASPRYPEGNRPRLFFLGRHRYYKGIEILLQAMTQIEADLWIGGDGEMRGKWMALTADLGLADRVRFFGDIPKSEVPGLYASVDLFVLPSTLRAEAFGAVLLEAMAAGLPCVTTELGTGTSFIVQDGMTGLVVPPREPNALAGAMRRLLEDPDLRARMGAAGQARVMAEFTVEKMAERVETVYQQAFLSLPR